MKVTVYFEAKSGAHEVAQFDEEETYMSCLPALETLAQSKGYVVTESVNHDSAEGLEINTNTAPDNNPVHEAVQFYFGDRCPEHEDGCPTCEAWKQYDAMRSMDLVIREVARVALGHGYLHLGEFTLGEFIGRELDLSDDELARALEYLEKSNAPTA